MPLQLPRPSPSRFSTGTYSYSHSAWSTAKQHRCGTGPSRKRLSLYGQIRPAVSSHSPPKHTVQVRHRPLLSRSVSPDLLSIVNKSSRGDWEDPQFWKNLIINDEVSRLPISVRFYKAFQRIASSSEVPGSFLLECPVAFNAILDVSLQEDSHTSGHLRHELCQHVFRQYATSKTRPPREARVYSRVMGKVLQSRPSSAQLYHRYLSHVYILEEEIASLITQIGQDDVATHHFQQFCPSIPVMRSAYPQIIARLCEEGFFDEALSWHTFLVENGCAPSNAAQGEPLRAHLSNCQPDTGLAEFDHSMRRATLQGFVNYLENVFPQGKKEPRDFSDSTIARGLATTFISVETAIKGLEFFGATTLGPLALRQLALRTSGETKCDLTRFKRLLQQLKNLKIRIEDCSFTRLVQKLVREDNAEMLHDVVTCDLHCDVFGDTELQMSLLAKFEAAMDKQGVERTLAILLTDSTKEQQPARRLNMQIQSCLIRDDRSRLEHLIEQTLASYTPIDADCLRLMHRKLSQGGNTSSAQHGVDAELIINIWIRMLDYKICVHASYWKTALKSMLTRGKLSQYDSTALRLTRWYLEEAGAEPIPSSDLLNVATGSPAYKDSVTRPQYGRASSLTYIFSMNHLTDVIAFGFYHGRQQDAEGHSFAKEAASFGRGVALAAHPMLWGLRTVLLLEARRVGIDRGLCLQRFHSYAKALSGAGVHLRDGRSVKILPGTRFEDYMEAKDILIQRIGRPPREEAMARVL